MEVDCEEISNCGPSNMEEHCCLGCNYSNYTCEFDQQITQEDSQIININFISPPDMSTCCSISINCAQDELFDDLLRECEFVMYFRIIIYYTMYIGRDFRDCISSPILNLTHMIHRIIIITT